MQSLRFDCSKRLSLHYRRTFEGQNRQVTTFNLLMRVNIIIVTSVWCKQQTCICLHSRLLFNRRTIIIAWMFHTTIYCFINSWIFPHDESDTVLGKSFYRELCIEDDFVLFSFRAGQQLYFLTPEVQERILSENEREKQEIYRSAGICFLIVKNQSIKLWNIYWSKPRSKHQSIKDQVRIFSLDLILHLSFDKD